ncbi:MAG: hypothetical protein U1E89_06380 [Burkholderiaceae bacterium]
MSKRYRIRDGMGAGSALTLLALVVAGCSGSGSSSDTVAVNGDVPIVYAKRVNTLTINPTNGSPFAAGGDLIVREKSSPSAPEHNITEQFTQGTGDASDPEVSYDGKKIVFSMRCPTSNTAQIDGQPACTGRWNIWEYTLPASGFTGGSYRRITASTTDDDVDPYYLPGGKGFVFASNRQTKTKALNGAAIGAQPYFALDEYERERVLNLHTMTADGGAITQISVNQSHDRNPVIRENGMVMFSRWEHVGQKNRFAIFQVKPDGTDMFVFYGALSPGNSFLHPREMDSRGPYKGQLASSLMPLQRSQEGGALMLIDAANFSENNTKANALVAATEGQRQMTQQTLNDERGFSLYGRITTPYPLWDGTNRILMSYRPCEVTKNGVVVSCATLTPEEITRLSNTERMATDVAADTVQDNVPASYAVYMYDPATQTQQIVAAPPAGYMYTDPIAIQPRPEPQVAQDTLVDAPLAAQNTGLIEVRSIYDTDGLDRMGETMLTAAEQGGACDGESIKKIAPTDTLDTRARVADLKRIKDPADVAYQCAPARFVRAFRAVPPPTSGLGLRRAIGATDFEEQQILGYAPVEPDGSFKLHVPADTPLGLAMLDAKGRAIQTHLNWIQVRPGERRTCDGCHSPRRGASLNSGATVDTVPAAWTPAMATGHSKGETMASTRTRLDPTALDVKPDMVSADIWANTAAGGVARPSISIKYTGNANPADDLQGTPAPSNGLINYPQHIAPIWTRARTTNGVNTTCTGCHNDPAKLDLRSTMAGTGRLTSYEELLIGDPVIDPATGLPQIRIRNGEPEVVRGSPLVESMPGSNALGMTRASRLGEIMWGEELKSSAAARQAHPNPPNTAPDHGAMLTKGELRLMSEWMDLGGQYYNDPFDGGVATVSPLSEATFETQVFPILSSTCAAMCHQAGLAGSNVAPGTTFAGNRFVLTGSVEGDYGVTLSMISDTCSPATSYLLARPSTNPHPSGGTGAVLPVGSANYNAIAAWIQSGCAVQTANARARAR